MVPRLTPLDNAILHDPFPIYTRHNITRSVPHIYTSQYYTIRSPSIHVTVLHHQFPIYTRHNITRSVPHLYASQYYTISSPYIHVTILHDQFPIYTRHNISRSVSPSIHVTIFTAPSNGRMITDSSTEPVTGHSTDTIFAD